VVSDTLFPSKKLLTYFFVSASCYTYLYTIMYVFLLYLINRSYTTGQAAIRTTLLKYKQKVTPKKPMVKLVGGQ